MKSNTLLTLLLSTTTSAATLRSPPTRPRDAPHHRLLHTLVPSAPTTKSNARLLAATSSSSSSSTTADSTQESTQGGALLTLNTTTPDSLISSVQTTIRIPAALPPTTGPTANNPTGEYAASFWVGIGSTTTTPTSGASPCGASSAALRAGVDVFWDGSAGGVQAPFAWWQFGGAGEAGLQGEEVFTGNGTGNGSGGFAVAAGDVVRFTLSVGSGSDAGQGQVVVLAENFGGNVSCVDGVGVTGGAKPVRSVRQVVPVGTAQLCRTQAAWVVEDFPLAEVPDLPVALANFTSATFAGAGAVLADGSKRDVAGAQVLDINQQAQGGKLTSCEVVGGTSVKCTRVVGDE